MAVVISAVEQGRSPHLIRIIEDAAADRILARLTLRRGASHDREAEQRFPPVSKGLLLHAVQAAFAASTKVEERRALRFSMSLVPRALMGHRAPWTQTLEVPVVLEPETLTKLALVTDLWTSCLLIDEPTPGRYEIWGFWTIPTDVDPSGRTVPTELVVRVTAPASIHVALWGERVWSLDCAEPVEAADTALAITTLSDALGAAHGDPRVPAVWAIVRDIERRGHGGTLAISDPDDGGWSDGHIVNTFGPTISAVVDTLGRRRSFVDVAEHHACPREPFALGCPNMGAMLEHHRLRSMARAIGGMANVDGAVILGRADLRLVAFAARLRWERECVEVQMIDTVNRTEGPTPVARLGGMRHRSAAHWVKGNPSHRTAVVVSTDGLVTLLHGSGDVVHAFRPLTQGVDADLA